LDELRQLPIPLLVWYRENARVLPWRSDPTPYHVWISEIMLQQTRVEAVKPYYDRFLKKFTFNSIGLCYNNFLSDSLPVDHFDVAVKYIATEDKITLCKEDK